MPADRTRARRPHALPGPSSRDGSELVFALAHEVGNLLAAVRLQAHLLDEDLGPRQLAAASVDIDDLCARASALLSQARPLLSERTAGGAPVDVRVVLHALHQSMVDRGLRRVRFDIEMPEPSQRVHVAMDPEIVNPVLISLTSDAVEAARPDGRVRVVAEAAGADGLATMRIEDDGAADEPLERWPELPRRGRTLAIAMAHHVLGKWGGSIEARQDGERTVLVLRLPAA